MFLNYFALTKKKRKKKKQNYLLFHLLSLLWKWKVLGLNRKYL